MRYGGLMVRGEDSRRTHNHTARVPRDPVLVALCHCGTSCFSKKHEVHMTRASGKACTSTQNCSVGVDPHNPTRGKTPKWSHSRPFGSNPHDAKTRMVSFTAIRQTGQGCCTRSAAHSLHTHQWPHGYNKWLRSLSRQMTQLVSTCASFCAGSGVCRCSGG